MYLFGKFLVNDERINVIPYLFLIHKQENTKPLIDRSGSTVGRSQLRPSLEFLGNILHRRPCSNDLCTSANPRINANQNHRKLPAENKHE